MKKAMISAACCLLVLSGSYTVRGEGEEGRMIRVVSPLPGITLTVRDSESGEERDVTVSEEADFFLPAGHSGEVSLKEQIPGWVAAAEMPWKISGEAESFEVPVHPFSAACELQADAETEGEFQFALYDGDGKKTAEWKSLPHRKTVLSGLKPVPGSELTLRTVSAPEGFVRSETTVRVPLYLKEEEWVFLSEAVPFAEKTVRLSPPPAGMHLQFFAAEDDTEPCPDAHGKPAEYDTDEDGKFTAVLARGSYLVSAAETERGYYPLKKEKFFFDTEDDDLQISLTPICIHVRLHGIEGIPAGQGEIILYEDGEETGRLAAEEDTVIPSAWLEAGKEYEAVPDLPQGYVCDSSRIQFTVPPDAPEEEPVICFEVMSETVPPLFPPADPVPSEEAEEPEEIKEEEKAEEKKEEKTDSRTVPVYLPLPEKAESSPPQAAKPEDRGFYVVLKDMEGRMLSGAVLRVENEEGETIAQWVSGSVPHRIENGVTPGSTYIISQQTAAAGYERMQMKIRFTMPSDGSEEPLVTLQNKALESAALRDEPLQLPRTGLYISMALASLSLLAALILTANRKTAKK